MGCWILEHKTLANVPGTSRFSQDSTTTALETLGVDDASNLKRDKKNPDIILVPQPSESNENDPLLWPRFKKLYFYFICVYGSVLCGAMGPLVSADQVNIAALFDASLNAMGRVLSSYFVITLGIATIFLQAASIKIGKRPVYLLTTLLLMVSGIWCSYATNLGSFAGGRVIMGIGGAALEFLVGASIDDVFYVHERGLPLALWNMALLTGVNVTPAVGGQVLRDPSLGYRWAFRIFAITVGALMIMQIFWMPETTTYRKPVKRTNNDSASKETSEVQVRVEDQSSSSSSDTQIIRKRTFWQDCKPVNYYFITKSSIWSILLRPMLLLFTPIAFWGGLIYGMGMTFLVMLAVVISQIFSAPPYNFHSGEVGLTYLGPLVGTLVATLIAGPITNFLAKILSKKNNGIYEPEFRLPIVAFYCVFGIMGFVGMGWSLENHVHWIGPVIFFALANFAAVFAGTSTIGYVVDSCPKKSDATLGAVVFWKNLWSFGLTWSFPEQLEHYGPKNCFALIGGLVAFASLCTIPMYIYGKRCRAFLYLHTNFQEDDEVVGVREI